MTVFPQEILDKREHQFSDALPSMLIENAYQRNVRDLRPQILELQKSDRHITGHRNDEFARIDLPFYYSLGDMNLPGQKFDIRRVCKSNCYVVN